MREAGREREDIGERDRDSEKEGERDLYQLVKYDTAVY